MRRLLLGCLVLLVGVTGFGHAPGTYPEEETRQTGEFEVPKNPYQSGWTGYEYYYEKEPKKMPPTGQMPAFQSIQSVSTDRETPDDPEEFGYKASGAESPAHPTTTTTRSPPPAPPPTTTQALAPPVEVAPSSTTGTVSTSTSPTTVTTTSTGMYPLETVTPTTVAQAPQPETDSDQKAAANLAMYPGVDEEEKDEHQPPKNLLTTMFEKRIIAPNQPVTPAPKHPEGSYDAIPDSSDYNAPSPPAPTAPSSKISLKSGDSYDDLGGPSGYENVTPTKKPSSGSAPGASPTIYTTTTKSTSTQDYGSSDSGYGSHVPDSNPSKPNSFPREKNPYDAPESLKPAPPVDHHSAPKTKASTSSSLYGQEDSPSSLPKSVVPSGDYGHHLPRSESKGYDQASGESSTSLPKLTEPSGDYGHYHSPTTASRHQSPGTSPSSEPKVTVSSGLTDHSENDANSKPRQNKAEIPHGYEQLSGNSSFFEPNLTKVSDNLDHDNYGTDPESHNDASPGSGPKLTGPGESADVPYGSATPSHQSSGDSIDLESKLPLPPADSGHPHPAMRPHVYNPTGDSSGSLPSGDYDLNPGDSSSIEIINAFTPPRHGFESHKDTVAEPRGLYSPDDDPYPAPKIGKPHHHIGTVPSSKFAPGTAPDFLSNSNNAISPRDPYDHFGTVPHHSPSQSAHTFDNNHGDFEEERDGGYETNGVLVPDRSAHPFTTGGGPTDVRAQISEIDRIAESFENSAREPVEYDQKITSESSKGIIVEAGKDIAKKFGRKARKCCSCCDEKQPVSRQVETKVEPSITKQLVDPSKSLGEEPVQNFVPLQSTVGGSAYVQPQPVAQQPPQTNYQQPFQQYQPQYPQSYPYQAPQQSCGCQAQTNCCAPPAPCCLPTIPCCPPIPCCPQPKICCQPQPICLPPPTCCQISFQVPTIPICGRACPSCPCRRRVHKAHRLKRHAISSNCNRCSAAGEPWKALIHHREKRAAPGCASGFSTTQQNSCGTCGASHLRSTRVKRMGCLPCLGRKKRDTEENSHLRVKRMGCLPCLGRKKRSALSNCSQCNSLGHLFNRYKRSLFGCSPCQPSCSCAGRKKRSLTMKVVKRAPANQCDATCCDYSKCPNRQKKEALVPFM